MILGKGCRDLYRDIWIYSTITAFQEHGLGKSSSLVIVLEALIKEVKRL